MQISLLQIILLFVYFIAVTPSSVWKIPNFKQTYHKKPKPEKLSNSLVGRKGLSCMELILAFLTSKTDESYELCQARKRLPTERSRLLSSTGGIFPPWKVFPSPAQQFQAVTEQGMIIPNAFCSARDQSAGLGNSKLSTPWVAWHFIPSPAAFQPRRQESLSYWKGCSLKLHASSEAPEQAAVARQLRRGGTSPWSHSGSAQLPQGCLAPALPCCSRRKGSTGETAHLSPTQSHNLHSGQHQMCLFKACTN